jgi:hypothetical protein
LYPPRLLLSKCASLLTSAGIENPTGKMAIGQISEALFLLLIPVFFVRYGFKKQF